MAHQAMGTRISLFLPGEGVRMRERERGRERGRERRGGRKRREEKEKGGEGSGPQGTSRRTRP